MPNLQGPSGTVAAAPYGNPLRHVQGLTSYRIDQGVDYAGSGPVYALGPGVIEMAADGPSTGWPGGGFIVERLTAGPDAGQRVYWAENITPVVREGDRVDWTTQVGTMHGGIETGWAAAPPNLGQALAYVKGQSCYSGSDPGCHPTPLGENFNRLMVSLGAPSGVGPGASSHGTGPGSSMSAATSSASTDPTCLIGFHLPDTNPLALVGIISGTGAPVCLLPKPSARALLGGTLMVAGSVVMVVGLVVVMVAAGIKGQAPQKAEQAAAAAPGGKAAVAAAVASPSGTAPPPARQKRTRGPTSRSSGPKAGTYRSASGSVPPPPVNPPKNRKPKGP